MITKSKLYDVLGTVLVLVGALWAIRFYDQFFPPDLNQFGIKPRMLAGLPGIFLAPFLHEGFGHLINNTIPLMVLLILLLLTQDHPWRPLFWIAFLGGSLLWLVGREASHIGASTLIFGLVTYLIASGLWHRRFIGSAVALAVLLLYGGSLLSSVLPRVNSNVSWEGHLSGAVAGVVVAWLGRRREQSALGRKGFDLSRISGHGQSTVDV